MRRATSVLRSRASVSARGSAYATIRTASHPASVTAEGRARQHDAQPDGRRASQASAPRRVMSNSRQIGCSIAMDFWKAAPPVYEGAV